MGDLELYRQRLAVEDKLKEIEAVWDEEDDNLLRLNLPKNVWWEIGKLLDVASSYAIIRLIREARQMLIPESIISDIFSKYDSEWYGLHTQPLLGKGE